MAAPRSLPGPSVEPPEVPERLRRLWRLPAKSHLGRPARLDVDQVVGAAAALADAEGLVAVTLPRIAERLGVTKMSLYRYVGDKEELLGLLHDHAIGTPPDAAPADAGAPWRAALRTWAEALREVYRRSPWLVDVPVAGPPSGPNALAWLDAGLRALRGTELPWSDKLGVIAVVNGYVHTAARLAGDFAADRAASGRGHAQVEAEYGAAMARLVDPERFPEAAALFAAPPFPVEVGGGADGGGGAGGRADAEEARTETPEREPLSEEFSFGLELILNGVGVTVETRGRG